jgi:hypothetical protein
MFVVKRCVQDYDDVFKREVASFESESEAEEFAANEDASGGPFRDVWHEVHEE